MSAPAAESEPTSQMEQIAARTYLSTEYAGSTVGFYVMPTGVVAVDAQFTLEMSAPGASELARLRAGPSSTWSSPTLIRTDC